jgi:hypothetical protein
MFLPFFTLAAQSPTRQKAFRQAVVSHLGVMLATFWATRAFAPHYLAVAFGHVLLIAGMVEGAVLIGWRLSQMPKSQALEFLLVSQLQPWRVFLAEAFVGLSRLAFVMVAGLPLLILLVRDGRLLALDVLPLLLVPFSWGTLTGLGLAAWAYEPLAVRRQGERFLLALVVIYLGLGVLAAERLPQWLGGGESAWKTLVLQSYQAVHEYNPFAILQFWLEKYGLSLGESTLAWHQVVGLGLATLAASGLLLARAASRLKEHFHERHYRPILDCGPAGADGVSDWPLSWWAVRRVMEYSGRVNLWLAGGFGLLYALYHVTSASGSWPPLLGRRAFEVIDRSGGIPTVSTALVVLASVPAAFQYGLWDSNTHERCRRLELLLLTDLGARDYWEAAAAAAWRRGRGYFGVAVLLWFAEVLAQPADLAAVAMAVRHATAALAAGAVLWGVAFAVGFRAFSKGLHANHLGMALTVGVPALTVALYATGWPQVAGLLPPGGVYGALAGQPDLAWLPGTALAAFAALAMTRTALARCEGDLRAWYDRHHGRKVVD